MQILVDADALPNVIKDILFRAVKRLRIPLTMVANQYVTVEKLKIYQEHRRIIRS